MAKVEIYTAMFCGYCMRALALLKEKNAEIEEIDVGGSEERWHEMTSRAGGRRTVPQIFIDGRHIGGSDDLLALEERGELDALLAGSATP